MHKSSDFELSFLERLAKDNPNFVDALIPLAEAYTHKGLYEKGLEIDKQLAKLRGKDPVVQYNLACSFALVGKKDEAFLTLKRAIQFGYTDFEHMEHDSDLKNLREDPRFKTLTSVKKQPKV